jgi:hypothetical protein
MPSSFITTTLSAESRRYWQCTPPEPGLPGCSPDAGVGVGRGFGVGATMHGFAVLAGRGAPELCAVHEPPLLAVHPLPPPDPHDAPLPLEPLAEHEFPLWLPLPPLVLHDPPCEPLALHEFPPS